MIWNSNEDCEKYDSKYQKNMEKQKQYRRSGCERGGGRMSCLRQEIMQA